MMSFISKTQSYGNPYIHKTHLQRVMVHIFVCSKRSFVIKTDYEDVTVG